MIIVSAIASKNQTLLKAVMEDAKANLTPETITAAKIAAALMGMNNVYYRFIHSVTDPDYSKMPANLRMTMMGQSGVDKKDFELFSLAVSAVNGCSYCMDAHEKSLIKLGTSKEVWIGILPDQLLVIINSVATRVDIEAV